MKHKRENPIVRCIKWRSCEISKGCVLAIPMPRPGTTRGFTCPFDLKPRMWTDAVNAYRKKKAERVATKETGGAT